MDITTLLKRGGVWYSIPGRDSVGFIDALASTIRLPGGIDRDGLAQACAQREASSSTAMGRGLSFPHPSAPMVKSTEEAFVALAYPRFPVDWKAPDGVPVRAVFLILSASRNDHLVTLSSLAKLCGDDEFYAALEKEATLEELERLIKKKAKP